MLTNNRLHFICSWRNRSFQRSIWRVASRISFREGIYENKNIALDLYPTGSIGVFDVYINSITNEIQERK